MACDVRIVALLLLVLHSAHATDFGLEFSINPAPDIVVPPNATVTLHCQTNLPSDNIQWHLNHAPLPHQHLAHNNDDISHDSKESVKPGSSASASSHSVQEEIHHRENNSDGKLLIDATECHDDRNGTCPSPPYRVITYDNHTSSLQIHVGSSPKLYEQQLGIYQCLATLGSISLASSASRLDVAVIAPFAARNSSEVMAVEGAAARIPCPRPHSIPPALLSFTRDQQPLLLDHSRMSVSPSGDLLIASASSLLSGVYRCSATNPVLGTTVHDAATTTVSVMRALSTPAKIISPTPGMTIATEGEDVRLYCLSNQSPGRVKMQWTVEDSSPSISSHPAGPTVTSKAEGSLFPDGSVLFLPNVSSNDSGKYVCSGLDAEQSEVLSSVVELYVQAAPRVVSGLVSASLSEGQRLQVRCALSGRPAPLLTWLSNGRRLVQGEEVTMLPDGSLIVASVGKQLAGVLQCFGHNAAGSASSHAFYSVTPNTVHGGDARHKGPGSEERPRPGPRRHNGLVRTVAIGGGAPSSPTVARAADDAVRLTWTPPRRRHRLLFYKVQYRVVQPRRRVLTAPLPGLPPFTGSGGRQWRTDDTTIHAGHNTSLVAGLTPGLTYKFRVAAVFAGQDDRVSPSSARFLLRRSDPLRPPPSPPRIQSVWRDSNGQLGVSWQYTSDAETDGFIIGYKEAGTDRPYTKLRYLGGGRRRLSLAEVPPGPAYDLRVQAFNMAGSSPPSPARTTAARTGSVFASDKSQLLIPGSLQGSASNLQSSSPPGDPEPAVGLRTPQNTSKIVPFTVGSKTNKDVASRGRNNVQLLHANDYATKSTGENRFPSYGDQSFEYQEYYEMKSNEQDYDVSEEDSSSEEDLSSGRSAGGTVSSLSSMHLLVVLVCVLLGLLALVVVSYLLYARREKRGYGSPVEQFRLESTCSSGAPGDGRHCLQSLGSPVVSSTSARAPYQQPPSPLTMPD